MLKDTKEKSEEDKDKQRKQKGYIKIKKIDKQSDIKFKKWGLKILSTVVGLIGFCQKCKVKRTMLNAYEIRHPLVVLIHGECEICNGEMIKKERL